MTPKEKLRLKEQIVRLWYFGEVDKALAIMCRMVGWRSVCNPRLINSSQRMDIEILTKMIGDGISKKKPKAKKFRLLPEREVA